MDIVNIVIMVLVGGVSGTLAAQIMRGNTFGFIPNALLGIAGAVVGGTIFDFFGMTPGQNITRILSDTFGVQLPQNLIGMMVSATLGAIVILWLARMLGFSKRRR